VALALDFAAGFSPAPHEIIQERLEREYELDLITRTRRALSHHLTDGRARLTTLALA